MSWNNETYLIGEKVETKDGNSGVITRIDKENGLIYVLFKQMREEKFLYPEDLELKKITVKAKQK